MSLSAPWRLQVAVRCLRRDGVIAYPTEGVFGLGCRAQALAAVERILFIKQRAAHKGLILIAAQGAQLRPFLEASRIAALIAADAQCLQATTFIVPAKRGVPSLIRGHHDSIAVRLTRHPDAAALCRLSDSALVSTSANLAAHQALDQANAVQNHLGHRVDYVLHRPCGDLAGPTEIRDLLSGQVLRPGAP